MTRYSSLRKRGTTRKSPNNVTVCLNAVSVQNFFRVCLQSRIFVKAVEYSSSIGKNSSLRLPFVIIIIL